jgi:hypothetical protein
MQFGHERPKHTEHNPDASTDQHAHERDEPVEEANVPDALDTWIAELAGALDIDSTAIDRNLVLSLSRATHRVARAAAPLTIFLVGMAAGLNGGGAKAVSQAAATAQRLASKHTAPAE